MKKLLETLAATAVVEYVRCPITRRLILRSAATKEVAKQPSGLTVFAN
jgi:hypothetical protein